MFFPIYCFFVFYYYLCKYNANTNEKAKQRSEFEYSDNRRVKKKVQKPLYKK